MAAARVLVVQDRPAGGATALQADGLGARRGGRTIFRGVSLALGRGEVVALLGGNGAGKTTLLHCLAGVLRPEAGEVRLAGGDGPRSPEGRRRIGWLGHESGLYPALTARENLAFAGQMHGLGRRAASLRADELLEAAGLGRQGELAAGRLSRGQRQRLAVVRAVLHEPEVLLLDEPYTSLDVQGRQWLTDLLGEARERGRAVFLATHEPEHCRSIVDRTVRLAGGGLLPADREVAAA